MKPYYKPSHVVPVFVCVLILFLLMSVLMLWGVSDQSVKWIAGTFFVSFVMYFRRHEFMQLSRTDRTALVIFSLLGCAFCYLTYDPIIRLFARLTS